jgi:hypothetical protein
MDQESARRRARAAVAPAVCAGIGVWLACGDAEAPPTTDWGRSGEIVEIGGIQAPARAHDDGTPDPCELLGRADPRTLLGGELAPARRIYGLCLVDALGGAQDAERSVGLEIRRDRAAAARNLDEFWEREGGGVGLLGSSRERIQELPGPGDYSLWFPIDGGLQLFSYWNGEYVLVLTVRGVPEVRALPWACELARTSVAAAAG